MDKVFASAIPTIIALGFIGIVGFILNGFWQNFNRRFEELQEDIKRLERESESRHEENSERIDKDTSMLNEINGDVQNIKGQLHSLSQISQLFYNKYQDRPPRRGND